MDSKVTKEYNGARWAGRWPQLFHFSQKCENVSGSYWLLQLQA